MHITILEGFTHVYKFNSTVFGGSNGIWRVREGERFVSEECKEQLEKWNQPWELF